MRVTSSVQDNVNHGDRWCQFRIRFWRDEPPTVNPFRDYAEFTDAEDTCCDVDQPPMLVLEYVP